MEENSSPKNMQPVDYGALFNAINDAIFVHDIDTGDILEVNDRACEMFCYSREELQHLKIGDISADIEPYRQDDAIGHIRKAASGEPQVFEWMSRDKAGRFFWVEVSLKRAVIAGRYRILAIVRDISHRKEDEAVLRLAEFSMKRSADYIFWVNQDSKILYANDAACNGVRYSQEELLEMSVPDIVPSFKNGSWANHWAEVKGRGHLIQQNMMRRKDGTLFPIEVSINYLEFEGEEYICAFIRDITDRKRTEDRIKSINEVFLGFGMDVSSNINRLVALCGKLLGADCALYNRIEGNVLSTCGQWNAPADLKLTDNAKGHICYDVVNRESRDVVVINNLPDTEYFRTDPNVKKYKLRTYAGKAVIFDGRNIGSICLVYQNDFHPTEADKGIMSIIASAIGTEESRGNAELTVAEDEKFLSEVFTSIQDGVCIIDKDMTILRVNATMEKWYDYAMPLVGKKCYEAYHGRSEICKICPTVRTLESGKAAYEVVPRMGAHGEVVGTLELYSFPLIDSKTGELKGAIEYVHDVSEKRAAEEAVTKRDYQLEILLCTSQHINAVHEVGAVLRTLVAAGMELVDANVGTAGLISKGFVEFPEVNSLGKIEHAGYSIKVGEGTAGWSGGTIKPYLSNDEEHTKKISDKLNAIIPIHNLVSVPIVNSKGSLMGCFQIANKRDRLPFDTQDVFMLQGLAASASIALDNARLLEQEKILAENLRNERDQAQAYLDTAAVMMIVIDKDQKVKLINKSGCEILGYQTTEMIGRNWFDDFIPKRFREETRAVFSKLIAGNTEPVKYYENTVVTKSGDERMIAWHNVVLYDESGRVSATLSSGTDITERRRLDEEQARLRGEVEKSYKRLKQLAMRDYETGLYNHHYLSDIIEGEYYRAKRYAHPLSIIMLDIDYFKSINDTYGHDFGDLVLKQFAKSLKNMVRKYDTIVRYGGEEFAIVSSVIDRSKAMVQAQRILDAINLSNFGTSKQMIKLKLSIGVASYPTDNAISGKDLINISEKILARAKDAGGNRVYSSIEAKKLKKNAPLHIESEDIEILKDRVAKLTQKGNQNIAESIFAFAKTLELRDHYTSEHTENTVLYSTEIAKAMGLPTEEVEHIRQASILHDLGKVGISDKILHKKGKLTRREFEEIRRHPQIAADIIRPVQFLHDIIPLILYHHERWDGKGYPSGLIGPEIPLGARIISVADVYQALTSRRPYRRSFSEKEALKIIKQGYGTQFDPDVIDIFLKVLEREKKKKGHK